MESGTKEMRKPVESDSGAQRERLLGQRGFVIWVTGLSASGKSTISRALEQHFLAEGRLVYILDGDDVRRGLNSDLGFSPEDRQENIRRIGESAALFRDVGVITIVAFISPYKADRERARRCTPEGFFIEVYLSTPIEACEARDPKGLYKMARVGAIPDFTGVSAPYEAPDKPEIEIDTSKKDIVACVDEVFSYLREKRLLPAPGE